VPELHAQLSVNAIDFLDFDVSAFTIQQDVNPAVTIPNPCLTDLPDLLRHGSLIGAAGLVVERRAVKADGATSLSDRNRPLAAHPANQFAYPTRVSQWAPLVQAHWRTSFRRITSVRMFPRTNGVHTLTISRSSVRSATIFFSRTFSSLSCFSRFISGGNRPAYFFFQLKLVAWLIPAFRQISATVAPSSPCLMMNAFCASEP
jgi:hypothetical protein